MSLKAYGISEVSFRLPHDPVRLGNIGWGNAHPVEITPFFTWYNE